MIKIIKNPPPLERKSTKGQGELLRRLDPRTLELLKILPTLEVGEAFEMSGTPESLSGLVGRAESRSAREGKRVRRGIRIVAKTDKTAIVYILDPK